MRKLLTALLLCLFLTSCTKRVSPKWTKENSLVKTSAVEVQDDLNSSSLITAVERSITYYERLPKDRVFVFNGREASKDELIKSHELFLNAVKKYGLSPELNEYLEENFDFFSSASDRVLVTGYFEASLKGSRTQSKRYQYPLYKKPSDLVTINLSEFFPDREDIPKTLRGRIEKGTVHRYYNREEIDYENALRRKDLELVYVDNLLDAFFLHIQGSGIVYLDDGSSMRVNYGGQNGQAYRSIGKYLVDNGYLSLEEASMQSIRRVLSENPQIVKEVLTSNPSYVFFRKVDKGPVGSIGQVVTPYRSVALDKGIFPRGAIAILKTSEPNFLKDGSVEWKEFSRFVVNQDTGGAIRGAGRVDYFMGHGDTAANKAGVMKQDGELYFILKK